MLTQKKLQAKRERRRVKRLRAHRRPSVKTRASREMNRLRGEHEFAQKRGRTGLAYSLAKHMAELLRLDKLAAVLRRNPARQRAAV